MKISPVRLFLEEVVTILLAGLAYYFFLPAINIHATKTWMFAFGILFSFSLIHHLSGKITRALKGEKEETTRRSGCLGFFLPMVLLATFLFALLFSHPFFHAEEYASRLDFQEVEFTDVFQETERVSNIALMDSDSAFLLANRTMGSLADMVSQYSLNFGCTTFNINEAPQKSIHLEYAGFFKWVANKDNGIPGYILVDPVNSTSKYIPLDSPMVYVPSACFEQDLTRKLRLQYPFEIFDNYFFEIDDNGKPWFIVPVYDYFVGMFGAKDIVGAILFDPCTGESSKLAVEEIPTWVDNVFHGDVSAMKYDWYGLYSNGFLNSLFAKKGCKVTTDDFGYICMNDDIYTYTGVTSVVSDESNIGFLMSNSRTGKSIFFEAAGAEEYSAMGAAEGEVQEKGYIASFPSLINIQDVPTYIMVLKDANGIVKMYGLVNATNYSVVAVAENQEAAKAAYIKLLNGESISDNNSTNAGESSDSSSNTDSWFDDLVSGPGEEVSESGTIQDIKYVPVGNITYAYVFLDSGTVIKARFIEHENLILLNPGDAVQVVYTRYESNELMNLLVSIEQINESD